MEVPQRAVLAPRRRGGGDNPPAPASPASAASPASQHEALILQRGRKSVPVSWSPIQLRRPLPPLPPLPPSTPPPPAHRPPPLRRIPLTPEKIDFSHIKTPKKFQLDSPVKSPPRKRVKTEVETVKLSVSALRVPGREGRVAGGREGRGGRGGGKEGRGGGRAARHRFSLRLLELVDHRTRDRLTRT